MKKTLLKGIAVCLFIGFVAFNGHANPGMGGSLKGKVLETMDASGYTYLKLDTGSEQPWVAIPQASVKVGEEVECRPGMVMSNFNSKTLNRTFDSIIFSAGLAGGASNPHGGMMGSMGTPAPQGGEDSFASAVQAERGGPAMQPPPAAESGGSMGAQAPFSEIEVEKASGENGHTVSEIFSKRDELNGKTVAVKGKVVKFSTMIMGRNWIHLQDGTGDPMKNTHDLVVTTSEEVNNGDIVTIEGVLAANKDFGAGYKYEAIVENAKTLK